jgi:polyadenylate-binding protein
MHSSIAFPSDRKLTLSSTADESALRAKVEEAMNVYDEYVKNKDGEGEKEKEEPKEEKA